MVTKFFSYFKPLFITSFEMQSGLNSVLFMVQYNIMLKKKQINEIITALKYYGVVKIYVILILMFWYHVQRKRISYNFNRGFINKELCLVVPKSMNSFL